MKNLSSAGRTALARCKGVAPTTFTRNDLAAAAQVPVGTASAWCSYAVRDGILEAKHTRPRQYFFVEQKASETTIASPVDVDEALTILVDISDKGVNRSNLAAMLRWIATKLEESP